jgi:hypothetical protein
VSSVIINLTRKLLQPLGSDQLEVLGRNAARFVNEVNREIRRKNFSGQKIDGITSFDGLETLTSFVLEDRPPWSLIAVESSTIPGMLTHEERQYYRYIGRFYCGLGSVVELGPWLGCSTLAIVSGIIGNSNFADKKLQVYDDFVWRPDWMDQHVPEALRLSAYQDFQFLFEKYTEPISTYLAVNKRKIVAFDGNEGLPQLTWDNGPIEFIYADCGRTFAANEGWYRLFEPFFLPGKTLLILQDWQTHSEVPPKWYNQIKQFVDSKGPKLQLVHELKNGTIATFVYR